MEMTRQLLESPLNTVIAACRNPSKAAVLNELANDAKGTLHVVKLDADDERSIHACAAEVAQIVGDTGVDYVVNNAGVVRILPSPSLACASVADVADRTPVTRTTRIRWTSGRW